MNEKPKQFWRFFKARTTACFLPDIMFLNDQEITSAEEKAEAFNRYFVSTFRPDLPISQKCSPSTCSQSNLEFIFISSEVVSALLSSLKTDKATGPDGISARLLTECANEIAPSLTALFTVTHTTNHCHLAKSPKNGKKLMSSRFRKEVIYVS